MPENLCDSFQRELKQNIKQDFGQIKQEFSCQQGEGVTFGKLKDIQITFPSSSQKTAFETHYRGKVALVVTFTDSNKNTIKVVYKPRNVNPDKHLESLLSHLQGKKGARRAILPIHDTHGYDTYIEGETLGSQEKLTEQMIRHIRNPSGGAKSQRTKESAISNCYLACALHLMGFEDMHNDNFIIDRDGYLYFIDAECYCTKVSDNLSDIFQRGSLGATSSEEEIMWEGGETSRFEGDQTAFTPIFDEDVLQESIPSGIDKEIYELVKAQVKSFQEKLIAIPSRVVFCPTAIYALYTPAGGENLWQKAIQRYFYSNLPEISIGSKTIKIDSETISFEDLHTYYLASFLSKHGYLAEYEHMGIESLKAAVGKCFEDSQALYKIHLEVQEAKNQNKNLKDLEVPVFHFHAKDLVLICDLIKQELKLKK